eukprot:CAMPEP_0174835142 /NCGR_PEP_ID=MMETSP1114-20130205/5256_1 /TAXON_ID=312471 /ORGANISM="Neobodo designis, Strain CCAP 1951/1" /LENGTH=498 /DNA_ID=CAMNT_0016069087 /DNA_START=239 /DNA_END=1735 /DNA_ORIENTATION=-
MSPVCPMSAGAASFHTVGSEGAPRAAPRLNLDDTTMLLNSPPTPLRHVRIAPPSVDCTGAADFNLDDAEDAGGADFELPHPAQTVSKDDPQASWEANDSSTTCSTTLGSGASGSVRLAVMADHVSSIPHTPPHTPLHHANITRCSAPADGANPGPTTIVAVKTIRETTDDKRASAEREMAFAQRVADYTRDHGRLSEAARHHLVRVYQADRNRSAKETTITMELLPGTTVLDIPDFRTRRIEHSVLPTVPDNADSAPGTPLSPTLPLHVGNGSGNDLNDARLEFARTIAAGACADARMESALRGVARDVVHGLDALHNELRVVHRDIKPANLLLDHRGAVKIADFGVSFVLPQADGASLADDQAGSLLYLAPERLRGNPHGAPCDVWSLGVTLLELALGFHPFGHNPSARQLLAESFDSAASAQNEAGFWRVVHVLGLSNGGGHNDATTPSCPPIVAAALQHCDLSTSFNAFVLACLASDPSRRATAAELLRHAWITA